MTRLSLLIVAVHAVSMLACCDDAFGTIPVGLRCESTGNPLGVDSVKPRLSWKIDSDEEGMMQTAYQIEVVGAWDSGKVESDRSIAIPYGGAALQSGKTYHWRVRVWDQNGAVSPWSESARWTMGKLRTEDWSAKWIAPPEDPVVPNLADLRVDRAVYRTLDGAVEKDVTAVMRRVAEEKRLPFRVDFNQLGGDPAPNIVKELVVDYTLDCRTGVSRARDFDMLAIPQPLPGVRATWFRGEFNLPSAPESALVTVQSPGYFELVVNGEKVGEDVLMPAVADTRDRTFVVTYEATRLLKAGRNCLGIWVAKGWADHLALRAQLDASVGGRPFVFGTGPDWTSRPSNISHIGGWSWHNFGGEHIDARLDVPDWAKTGSSQAEWLPVAEAAAPKGAGVWHSAPPNRIGQRLPPVSITALAEGRYEIDFGRNLTGWLRMKMPDLPAGRLVRLHFADRVFPDGIHASPIGDIAISRQSCVDFPRTGGGHNSYQTYRQTSEFVSGGRPGEIFQNKFNYAGFRYVVVEGIERAPAMEDAVALLVESAMRDAGSFACSDSLLNRIHEVNRWTQRCLNLGSYYVDCPTRERMGYGDGQVAIQGMMMNFDAATFYQKWAGDWRLGLEMRRGYLPYVAPPFEKGGGGPPWPGGIARIPWEHYLHYGDPSVLEENLDGARKYCEYLDSRATNGVLRDWGGGFTFIGDWVPPGRGMDTQNWPNKDMAELFCNCFRVHLWQLVERMSAALGRDAKAKSARQRADAVRAATHAAFFDAANKRYVIDEQIYYAFPLLMEVTPEAERPAVLDNLVKCIAVKNRGHLDTGMLGTLILLEYLNRIGRDDLVLGIYQKKDYPGWGYMMEQGATTMWEQWNGYWSQIHSCFTSADNWLYQGLAGIRPDPGAPGFKNVIIRPAIVGDITWVKASHTGPYGTISSHWKRDGARITLEVVIPPNSTATVFLPGRQKQQVGSGSHQFESTLAPHQTP
ncbi:MAG: family 78 glycoside hydrolase catalytic domain [Verrucomicrobia bacterium]|nr:family 78 glycoside hydrolase catalytic domain [Verrucomicrobiota bacterium]